MDSTVSKVNYKTLLLWAQQDPQYLRKETNIINNNTPEIAVLQSTLDVIDQSDLKYDGSNISSGKNISMKSKVELMKQIQTCIEEIILRLSLTLKLISTIYLTCLQKIKPLKTNKTLLLKLMEQEVLLSIVLRQT